MLIQLFLAALATAIIFITARDYMDKKLPKSFKFKDINDYLNSNHHWHSYGHFLVQFMIMTVLGSFNVIMGVCLSVGSAFFIEFVLQRNKLRNFDTIFDLVTHILGIIAALSLFL